MANPNLLAATSCTLNHSSGNISTAQLNIVGGAASNTVRKIISLYVCNTSSSTITFSVSHKDPGGDRWIVRNLEIPTKATINVITKETPIVLAETYYTLQAVASASGLTYSAAYEDYS